ncbi:MAG: InlB B-repeat-containing protein [Bacteroidales bacterium]|nr:InlB B-repeat-containing protein [Bacteroidales bacterium]
MKKFTLLLVACSMTILSFAAGGNITYELNGGVTNDHGWKNKNDMYMGLNAAWNTFKGVTATWTTLDALIATYGSAVNAVPKGIPTEASAMALDFVQDATVKAEWQWLVDYMDAICKVQAKTLPSSNAAYLRYNLSAFFFSSVRAGWPASADYTVAGQTDAFMPAWKHAFAGPASYDGTAEVVIPIPYKEGYTFDGWFDNAAFTGSKIASIAVGAEGDKALYAKWIEYIPTCAEVKALGAGKTTKAGGFVTLVSGTTAYIQDASAGLMIEFTEAPAIVAGDKITLSGTTAALGSYLKVTGATLLAKEAGAVPTQQTLTLALLKADVAAYMHEYVYFEGLKVVSYGTGNVVLADDAESSITLDVDLNQSTIPVNTKVNVKAIVTFDTEVKLVTEASKVTVSPVPRPDPSSYAALEDDKYTLTSKWLVSNTLDNLSANPIGTTQMVRGMTAKDGKMYFIDREYKQITVVDGATGKKLAPIALASNIFLHTTRNAANTADSTYLAGTLQYNDIKQDSVGNILISNLTTSIAQPFQVWKIDLATGNGTLIVDEILKDNPDFAAATVRFDAFGVYGDVTKNAIIMAANASAMEAYKWTITNGVVGKAESILIGTGDEAEGTFLKGLTNPGTAPQIFPIDNDYFYLDGNATLPTLIDMTGQIVDGFYNVPKEVEDWSLSIGSKQGHNGLVEFELGGEYFFLIAAGNTDATPPSNFRLLKWADVNKEFSGIKSMWTLPANGMGGASNPYRTAIPVVEVNESTKTATLYLYTGENGYGVYEFKINDGTGLNDVKNSILKISIVDRTVNFDKQVANVTVYSVTGQLVKNANNVSSVNVPTNGVFLVKATTHEGETVVDKVIVK